MSKRRIDPDDPEYRRAPDTGGDLPLFATATDAGMAALAETEAKNEALIEALIPLAKEIAHRAGPSGVTVSDLRLYAVQRGLLTGGEQGRALSFLGAVMRRAGLRNTKVLRRSTLLVTHGNLNTVWAEP